MIEPKLKPPSFTAPTEGVRIQLGDGLDRELRYDLRSLRTMKVRGLTRRTLDDDSLPELIWIGLHDAAGDPPEGVTIESIGRLSTAWFPYLSECYMLAFAGAAPVQEKKAEKTES